MDSKGFTDVGKLARVEQRQTTSSSLPGAGQLKTVNTAAATGINSHASGKQDLTAQQTNRNMPLETAVTKLNDYVQTINRTLSFSIDEDSGQTVIKVTNSDTEELIRQIPAEHTLKLAASLEKHSTQGLLINAKA